MNKLPVKVLVISHKFGSNSYVCKDDDHALEVLSRYVAEWWEQEMGGTLMPEDPLEARNMYFEKTDGREGYDLLEDDLDLDALGLIRKPDTEDVAWVG